jgi:hypothetical protein
MVHYLLLSNWMHYTHFMKHLVVLHFTKRKLIKVAYSSELCYHTQRQGILFLTHWSVRHVRKENVWVWCSLQTHNIRIKFNQNLFNGSEFQTRARTDRHDALNTFTSCALCKDGAITEWRDEWISVRKVSGSSLGPETTIRCFPQFLQAQAGTLHQIKPRLLSLQIIYNSLFDNRPKIRCYWKRR